MKKPIFLLFSIFLLILLTSCLSDPETKYTEAKKLKEKADKYELKKYAEEEYKEGDENLTEARTLIDSKKNLKASKVLDESNKNFKTVLDKGLPPYTKEQDKKALDQKETAKEIKTEVAVKEKFDNAEKKYNDAGKSYDSKEFEKAILLYNEAETGYKNAYDEAKIKMDKAKEAIESTEEYKNQIDEEALLLEEEEEEKNLE